MKKANLDKRVKGWMETAEKEGLCTVGNGIFIETDTSLKAQCKEWAQNEDDTTKEHNTLEYYDGCKFWLTTDDGVIPEGLGDTIQDVWNGIKEYI